MTEWRRRVDGKNAPRSKNKDYSRLSRSEINQARAGAEGKKMGKKEEDNWRKAQRVSNDLNAFQYGSKGNVGKGSASNKKPGRGCAVITLMIVTSLGGVGYGVVDYLA